MKRITLVLIVGALAITAFAQVPQDQSGQAGQQGKRARRGVKIFKQMDKNNDRQISREEWGGKAETFARLDRNNDGILTAEELRFVRKQPRDGQTPTQL